MNNSNPQIPNSVLKIKHFLFDKIQFDRIGFNNNNDISPAKISVGIQHTDTHEYSVSLNVEVEKPDEYIASVTIIGICELHDDTPNKDDILNINAPAILYPYARAELSLITAHPETTPLVLPVINFQALYENSKNKI